MRREREDTTLLDAGEKALTPTAPRRRSGSIFMVEGGFGENDGQLRADAEKRSPL